MFYLLFAIPLYSSKEGMQLILLFLQESRRLFIQLYFKLNLHILNFFVFEWLTNKFYFFGVDIIFYTKVYLLLFSKLNYLLVPSVIVIELFSDFSSQLLKFLKLFLL